MHYRLSITFAIALSALLHAAVVQLQVPTRQEKAALISASVRHSPPLVLRIKGGEMKTRKNDSNAFPRSAKSHTPAKLISPPVEDLFGRSGNEVIPICVAISRNGEVERVVVRSSPLGIELHALENYVGRAKFLPAMSDGVPVRGKLCFALSIPGAAELGHPAVQVPDLRSRTERYQGFRKSPPST